jgi:hypothetical protein
LPYLYIVLASELTSKEGDSMNWLETLIIVGGGILAGALIAAMLFGGDCPVIITFLLIGISMYVIYRIVDKRRKN